jgi:hypothetical protein
LCCQRILLKAAEEALDDSVLLWGKWSDEFLLEAVVTTGCVKTTALIVVDDERTAIVALLFPR